MTKMWKFLRLKDDNITSRYGNHVWSVGERYYLPQSVVPSTCSVGFHASPTPLDALNYVKGEVIALVSGKGQSDVQSDKTAFASMKLLDARRWTVNDNIALAVYSVELVLSIFEAAQPNDSRPREAIELAKKHLLGEDVSAYTAAVNAAAVNAANDAYDAAVYAAYAAAYAAVYVAYDATYAADDAAYTAAVNAAYAAVNAANAAYQINQWITQRFLTLESV